MPTTIKGHATCPECGSTQNVKHDGRKYFINCTECRTITTYQSKAAQQRVLAKLRPIAIDTEQQPTGEAESEATAPKPYKPAHASDSVFDSFIDLF